MRALAIACFCLLFTVPAWGLPQAHRGECRKLTRQIDRYVRDAEMARARGNELWEAENLRQIDRLASRRVRLCPQYARDDSALLRRIGAFLGNAARLGLSYLTFGAI